MTQPWASELPWTMTNDEFDDAVREADEHECACCVFYVDDEVDMDTRRAYAAMIIAYTRAGEPITVLPNGSAVLLITNGGAASGGVAARRIMKQLSGVEQSSRIRVGIAAAGHNSDSIVVRAQKAALMAQPGGVAVAE